MNIQILFGNYSLNTLKEGYASITGPPRPLDLHQPQGACDASNYQRPMFRLTVTVQSVGGLVGQHPSYPSVSYISMPTQQVGLRASLSLDNQYPDCSSS